MARPRKETTSLIRDSRRKNPTYESMIRLIDGGRYRKSLNSNDEKYASILAKALQRYAEEPSEDPYVILQHINDVRIKMGKSPVEIDFVVKDKAVTVCEAVDALLVSKSKVKESTFKSYESSARLVVDIMGEDSLKPINKVTVSEAQRMLDAHANGVGGDAKVKARASRTTLVFKKFCSGVWINAMNEGWCKSNPFVKAEISLTDSMTKEPFTPDEVERLRGVRDPEMAFLCTVASCTAMRLGDASKLRRSDLKKDSGRFYISFIPEKTSRSRKRVTVPVVEPLLSLIKDSDFEDFFMPRLAGMTVSKIDEAFIKIMDEASVDYRIETTPSGKKHRTKHFHSFRHYVNTVLAEEGVPQDIRREICGHASDDVNSIYSRHATKNALDKLNN